jgi:hypothetical protein
MLYVPNRIDFKIPYSTVKIKNRTPYSIQLVQEFLLLT